MKMIFQSKLILIFIVFSSFSPKGDLIPYQSNNVNDTIKQKANLEVILKILPPDRTSYGRISFLDKTFENWLKRTGELPPDFERMPSLPFLPNPLIMDEGGQNIPVKTMTQWDEKREWMKKQLQHYITGTFPPAPENLKAKILSEKMDGKVRLQLVELSFGPEHRAKLTMELMIPPGEGPFPVFLTQWNHREWAQVAVRRGYIGCTYAGADSRDDTEKYAEIWAGEYDWTRLMRRAWGASRAIDYLLTLPEVDEKKIALTGHSRNGKQSLMAAAFDERITACIPSSGGSIAEVPWRYNSINYDIQDIADQATKQPSWLHPRLRFYIGREHKLPIDQNSFMALIAPRGLMLSTAINEPDSNPWGIEQAYHATQSVYEFLGSEDNLAIRSRYGLHSVNAHDMENYIDFFDYVFKLSSKKPKNHLFFDYSFEKWLELSEEKVNPINFPVRNIEDLVLNETNSRIFSEIEWENKKIKIQEQIQWVFGEEPPGVTNPGPGTLDKKGKGEKSFGSVIERPLPTSKMGRMDVSPYRGFGDQLFGYLYYPIDKEGNPKNKDLPVVIFLHEFDYSKGFSSKSHQPLETLYHSLVDRGFGVFVFDMLGFGNRIEEGTNFYKRYPHWSKMGKMVADVHAAVDALENFEIVDKERIVVVGYSLGGMVGLYAAATDIRISGIVSVAGFTPMRTNTLDRGTEGILAYSHLHGLLPRLGFFIGNEERIPYDFHEVLACIAPRPALVVAPKLNKDAHHQDIFNCVKEVRKVYGIYDSSDKLQIFSPMDINRFSSEMKANVLEWLTKNY